MELREVLLVFVLVIQKRYQILCQEELGLVQVVLEWNLVKCDYKSSYILFFWAGIDGADI